MTVGFHAPLPPVRSGVADHAADLLPVLRSRFDVKIGRDGDVNVYHLGNNQLHASIYRRALAVPGIVVLHDAVMHHFALGYFDRESYLAEFMYNYGDWTQPTAEQFWAERSQAPSDPRYFAHPMLRRIAEAAKAVIVHNPAAARMVRVHAPRARVVEVPLLWIPIEQQCLAYNTRPLCGVFGHLRPSKRVHSAIAAAERAGVQLMIAGNMPPELARSLGPSLSRVRCEGYASRQRFHALLQQVDCCINLRYPSAGETSAIGVMAMGLAKAAVFTDGEEIARYPADACVRIDEGLAERDGLAAVLEWLALRRSHARAIGSAAAEHVRREHSAERVGDLYERCLVE